MSQTSALSTQPYKGTADFLPLELQQRNYIFNKWREVMRINAYQEYETSLLESAEIYRLKSGDELGTKQLFSFEDKGGRSIALRPEQTPSLARMVADNYGHIRLPLRWFSIPNCFRYEQPQRGRTREFWQLNVDIIGSEEGWSDLEMLRLAADSLLSLGAKKQDFTIFYSHRGILDAFLGEIGITEAQHEHIYKILDNWRKVPVEKSEQGLSEILDDKAKNQILCLLEGMDREMDLWNDIMDDDFPEFGKAKAQFEAVMGNKVDLQLNPSIVRGLAYYTGLVFEVYDTNPENTRSLFGGGRYNDLLDLYGKKASSVGFGAGQVPIANFLETHQLMPTEFEELPKIILIPTTEEAVRVCLLDKLPEYQASGHQVEIDYQLERALGKRKEAAIKREGEAIVVE